MKKLCVKISLLLLVFACENKNVEKVITFDVKGDTLQYDKHLYQFRTLGNLKLDSNQINLYGENVFDIAKLHVNHPLTLIPLEMTIYEKNDNHDTIMVSFTFSAENGYGVPGELHGYADFLKGKMVGKPLIIEK